MGGCTSLCNVFFFVLQWRGNQSSGTGIRYRTRHVFSPLLFIKASEATARCPVVSSLMYWISRALAPHRAEISVKKSSLHCNFHFIELTRELYVFVACSQCKLRQFLIRNGILNILHITPTPNNNNKKCPIILIHNWIIAICCGKLWNFVNSLSMFTWVTERHTGRSIAAIIDSIHSKLSKD